MSYVALNGTLSSLLKCNVEYGSKMVPYYGDLLRAALTLLFLCALQNTSCTIVNVTADSQNAGSKCTVSRQQAGQTSMLNQGDMKDC